MKSLNRIFLEMEFLYFCEKNILTMKTLRFIIAIGFCSFCLSSWAIDKSYYIEIDGKSGKTLFDAIQAVSMVGYHSIGYDGLWEAFKETDLRANGTIWDMYSNCTFQPSKRCGNYSSVCDCYNREHSIPKSWYGDTKSSPGCDIFHLVPTDGKINGLRSNYPFGEVASATDNLHGRKLGSSKSITVKNTIVGTSVTVTTNETVFEPTDEYKGDFARAYFGTMVRWANGEYQSFTSGNGSVIFSSGYTSSSYFGLTKYGVALLMKWHRQDPVSQKEIDRNNGIQQTQGNRNPFIDYPCLAEYLWGNQSGKVVSLNDLTGSFEDGFIVGDCDGCSSNSAVEEIFEESEPLIYACDGRIYAKEDICIYNLVGMDVTHLNGQLDNGIYLVKIGDKVQKIFVKK